MRSRKLHFPAVVLLRLIVQQICSKNVTHLLTVLYFFFRTYQVKNMCKFVQGVHSISLFLCFLLTLNSVLSFYYSDFEKRKKNNFQGILTYLAVFKEKHNINCLHLCSRLNCCKKRHKKFCLLHIMKP